MFKQQISKLRRLNIDNQVNNEEVEQCGRRLSFCHVGVPNVNNESSDDVLKPLKPLFWDTKVDIPEAVDRVYRVGPNYWDKSSNKNNKNVVVKFTPFSCRTMFYRAKKR